MTAQAYARITELYHNNVALRQTIAHRRDELLRQAEVAGLLEPSGVGLDSHERDFYSANADSVNFIDEVEHWDEFAGSLHFRKEGEVLAFHTRVLSSDLAQGAAGLAVRALVLSTVLVAEALGWECDLGIAADLDLRGEKLIEER